MMFVQSVACQLLCWDENSLRCLLFVVLFNFGWHRPKAFNIMAEETSVAQAVVVDAIDVEPASVEDALRIVLRKSLEVNGLIRCLSEVARSLDRRVDLRRDLRQPTGNFIAWCQRHDHRLRDQLPELLHDGVPVVE